MPTEPRNFQEVYDLIRGRIQDQSRPDADFSEGSFLDVFAGATSLAYQELQSLLLQRFSQTFLSSSQVSGDLLEAVAVDRYQEGARRPGLTNAVGVVTVTRKSGNTEAITITPQTKFTADSQDFFPREETTILPAQTSGVVFLTAALGGLDGNIGASQMWSSDLDDVDISNDAVFQGGNEPLNDGDYRAFIRSFVESLQDGTRQGLEGAAKITPGVVDARLIKRLHDVGTLDNSGALESDPRRFKAVELILYVAGSGGASNQAIIENVRRNVTNQLSAGEVFSVVSTTPKNIDLNVKLTFTSSSDALALSQRREELKTAFENYINSLDIGDDFVRANVQNAVLNSNNWSSLFTVEINTPAGDITVGANEKAVAGNVVVTVS